MFAHFVSTEQKGRVFILKQMRAAREEEVAKAISRKGSGIMQKNDDG